MKSASIAFKPFAWDGCMFEVPSDWELSFYHFSPKVTAIRMEDEARVRLEMEWVRRRSPLSFENVRRRHARMARPLVENASSARDLTDLPGNWHASLYTFEDHRRQLTACRVETGAGLSFVMMLKMHFDAQTGYDPEAVLAQVARSFRCVEEAETPWIFLDVSFRLPRDFHLEAARLEAGRKYFRFGWKMRRLHFWQFSLASILLRDRSPSEWAVTVLNAHPEFRGVRFRAHPSGELMAERRYKLGYYEEIAHRCFRYAAMVVHDAHRNLLMVWAFHHRKPADCEMVAGFRRSVTGAS